MRALQHYLIQGRYPLGSLTKDKAIDFWVVKAWEIFRKGDLEKRLCIIRFLLQNKTHDFFIYMKSGTCHYEHRRFRLSIKELRYDFMHWAEQWTEEGQIEDPEKVYDLISQLEYL